MSKGPKLIGLVFALVLIAIIVANAFGPSNGLLGTPQKEYPTGDIYAMLANPNKEDGPRITKAEWQGAELRGEIERNRRIEKFVTQVPEKGSAGSDELQKLLRESGATWKFLPPSIGTNLIGILGILAFPVMFILFLYFFVIKPAQMGGNQAMNFGRSRARRVGENTPKVTFDDVAGIDEAKQELFEIVDFLKNTKKYTALGAKIPKGILLTGPPGVGKTYLARAIAGEAGVPFFHISGSDFVEMFVGVGAARVRDLFETAKAHRPSLIFIDEIDAVGRQRGAGLGGGHDEREQTLNQLLVEMDGFDPNSGVIMIAATNRPDVLDPALLRPGRFDRQIVVDAPDTKGREKILKIHAKGKPLETELDLGKIAKRTIGFTGADLANMLNEAALLTARRNKTKVGQSELEEALDRVIAGPERKSRVIDPKEREIIAYHEAGHAIVGELLEEADPVHKVTILPRGMSLGSTWQLPASDKFLVSKEELLDDITALLGGRVAEEIVYGKIWTGASNDLERVTRIARAMVCEYGMSEKLGTLALGRRAHNPFLGRDYNEERNYGEEVAKQIDEEVRFIVDNCHTRARDLVQAHRHQLDALVQALLERETLDRDEFLKVMDGQPLPPLEVEAPTSVDATDATETEPSSQHVGRLEPGPA